MIHFLLIKVNNTNISEKTMSRKEPDGTKHNKKSRRKEQKKRNTYSQKRVRMVQVLQEKRKSKKVSNKKEKIYESN